MTPPPDHWFEPVAEHLGGAYLRYSFTKGTAQEVEFLVDALELQPGMRVLDVGCGPGRHAHALAARGIEVVGVAEGPAPYGHVLTSSLTEAESLAARPAFAGHGLIVRPESADDPRVRKDILSLDELRAAFADAQRQSASGAVFVEIDLRAHRNPRRMQRIAEAAADLAAKLASTCPACDGPGFWRTERLPGMPCRHCGLATEIALAEVDACPGCGHRATRLLDTTVGADPQWCDYCNP